MKPQARLSSLLLTTLTLAAPGTLLAEQAPIENDGNEAIDLDRVITTTTRSERLLAQEPASVARLEQEEIERVGHRHISELSFRIPGSWITSNSGQEHLTAIRSPVLTGPGACGAFQFLEDGIPIRAAGFCNVNGLFEVNSEQAAGIEVIRGPANALYGSNTLHGTINILSRDPADGSPRQFSLEAGPDAYYRAGASLSDQDQQRWRVSTLLTEDGGWRDDSGVSQQKLNARYHTTLGAGELQWLFAGSWLDQDTAGYVEGQDSYRTRPRDNDNPEAFRKVEAQRLAARWQAPLASDTELELTPYFRNTEMDFLQHFLPGQPLEHNSQQSLGLMSRIETSLGPGRLNLGLDLEYTESDLSQYQDGEVEDDNDFLRETRPPGAHYDYDVDAWLVAAYLQHHHPLGQRWAVEAGGRLEYLGYDYRNNLEAGNNRADGTPCGMGGCLYTRPEDRSDSFTTSTFNLGLTHQLSGQHTLFTRVAQGYRAPQATELYRLQSGQTVADLEPEAMDSLELGSRGHLGDVRYELVAYYMEKDNFIYRDAEGFNVSDGATRHRGVEVDLHWQLSEQLSLAANATSARHTWAFDRQDGEPIHRGDEVDGAPRHLGSARLSWQLNPGMNLELGANYLGSHYLDAANEHRYHGHTIFSLKSRQQLSENWTFHTRIHNLTDRAYAERPDYAFGNYRYFPGRERSVFFTVEYQQPH
ncbi:outer membrane receptor protein involved in Fe transport [Natronospira proteinivora]|uniref:Outer membrane receptor protein involved in Fe transport n=1 Tax=Natronospira proteinivora TaxID=1807133 RepID=A0ABT1GA38_9GAMM|nr:TonB-dependent receptor [Natronospira proteinivora]MCP1727158.1 outer membrane receptor protein involved in Fe transport [Natronospira proteinivora]